MTNINYSIFHQTDALKIEWLFVKKAEWWFLQLYHKALMLRNDILVQSFLEISFWCPKAANTVENKSPLQQLQTFYSVCVHLLVYVKYAALQHPEVYYPGFTILNRSLVFTKWKGSPVLCNITACYILGRYVKLKLCFLEVLFSRFNILLKVLWTMYTITRILIDFSISADIDWF